MKVLCLLLLSMLSQVLSKQWIDPHDMNTNAKKHLKKPLNTDLPNNANEKCNVNIEERNSLVYLKRVVNLLINSADISKTDMGRYGHLHFKLSEEDYQFLRSFSSIENIDIEDFRKMDTILSQSLQKDYMDDIAGMFLSTQDRIYQFISSQGLPGLAIGFCFPYVAYNLFKSKFSFWFAIRYLLLMVFMVDFIERSRQLREEAEEHNNHLKYALKCDTSKMSWAEYFTFMTGHEDCEIKVVSLLEVFLNQVKSVIIVPLSAAGTGMGQFGAELWRNLPFPWNILIFPIMLIFCAILTAIVMTVMNDTPFKINLMHLFHLEFGSKTPQRNITESTLNKILNAVSHRPLLQEVPLAKNTSPPKKHKPVKYVKEKNTPPKSSKVKSSEKEKQEETAVKSKEEIQEEVVTKVENKEINSSCEGNSD